MKKVTRFVSIFFILICSIAVFSSCDFLRKVSGRPTSEDLALMGRLLEMKEQMKIDSLQRAQDSIRIAKEAAMEQERLDSLRAVAKLDSMGTNLSDVFRFGDPENDIPGKFSAIIGVYRSNLTAAEKISAVRHNGFEPIVFNFAGGERAVCLISSDNLAEVADIVEKGRASNDCPKDAWIYVKH